MQPSQFDSLGEMSDVISKINDTFIDGIEDILREHYVMASKVMDSELVFWSMVRMIKRYGIDYFSAINTVAKAVYKETINRDETDDIIHGLLIYSMGKVGEYISSEIEDVPNKMIETKNSIIRCYEISEKAAMAYILLAIDMAYMHNTGGSQLNEKERKCLTDELLNALKK